MKPVFRHISPRRALLTALVMVPLLHGVAAFADGGKDDHEEALEVVRSGAVLPLRAILDRATAQFDGDMLEAELERNKRGVGWVYELEMMSPRGNVLKLWYSAEDGTLLNGRGHGLMHAYRGDVAALPEILQRHHEKMMERRKAHEGRGGPWHRRFFGRFFGDDDAAPDGPPGPPPGPRPGPRSGDPEDDDIMGDE